MPINRTSLCLYFKFPLITLVILSQLSACGGEGGSSSDDSNLTTQATTETSTSTVQATDISNVMLTNRAGSCTDYIGSFSSTVNDIQRGLEFNGAVDITVENNKCLFTVNEIPNHDFNDNSANFATNVSTQMGSYQITTAPTAAAQTTPLTLATTNAILLNGVVIDLLAAACYDVGNEPLGQEKIGCGSDQIENPWRYDPMSSLNGFGTDEHNAHTQPDGTYHYHGNPIALFDQDCDITATQSPVIGFAADGFPIYGSCFNDNGNIKKAQSSYQIKGNGGVRQTVNGYTTPVGGTGNVASNNYDGQFTGDYQFIENSGDLDKCNGMTVDGQYGYYITNSYPWVVGCFIGTTDSSLNKSGISLTNRLHSHSHN